jgi:hypothetical protein
MMNEFNEYNYQSAMEFIQSRNNEYYRIGDEVLIASLKEMISVEDSDDDVYTVHFNAGELMDGKIVAIECNSNDMPRNVEFMSQVYITVRYEGSKEDEVKPNCICVPHTDIINVTVLGDYVGNALFQATRDLPLKTVASLRKQNMWPKAYANNAWCLVASPEDKRKLRYLQEKANTGNVSALAEMETIFLNLNRELRFLILQDRFNNICTFYDFEAFPSHIYQAKRIDYNTIHYDSSNDDETADSNI